MIAGFFAGAVTSIAATILLALYLAARPKTEARPQHGVATTSVSLIGKGGMDIDAFQARQLNEALKNYKGTVQ